MNRSICRIFIFLFFLITVVSYGQLTKDIGKQIQMDYAAFRASEDWTYLELYFTIPRNALERNSAENRFQAMYETAVYLYAGDSLVMEKSWKDVDTVQSMEEIKKGQALTNQTSFYVREGKYRVKAVITDLIDQSKGIVEKTIDIRPFSRSVLDISDLELALQVRPDTTRTRFYKNGYSVIPNPAALYGLEIPVLNYYCEIYNLSPMTESGDNTYTITVSIKDGINTVVKALKPKIRQRKGQSLVDIGMVNVSGLPNGTYTLNVEVRDKGTEERVSRGKTFYVYRLADTMQDDPQEDSEKTLADEFAFMSEDELDLRFEYCRYIAESSEKKVFKKLDLDGKRTFMQEFWQKRDDDAFTSENEYKQAYYRRVAHANRQYTHGKTEGWKTDQGRIFIVYGEPDRIDRYPSSGQHKGYEVWEYLELQNRSIFVFVDVRSDGRLRLVHSTYMNEIQDYEWRRWLL